MDDQCEAVELASPARPALEGTVLVGIPLQDAKKIIEVFDPQCEIDETGLLSFRLGVGLYVPEMDEHGNGIVESVIVFRDGYYG